MHIIINILNMKKVAIVSVFVFVSLFFSAHTAYAITSLGNIGIIQSTEMSTLSRKDTISLVSPKSGETFTPGQSLNIQWTTSASPRTYVYLMISDSDHNMVKEFRTPNDGNEKIRLPQNTPAGQYTVFYQVVYGPMGSGYHMTDYAVFTVASPIILDPTPRIAMWYGKVNQHVDEKGNWQTDPDGRSGAGSYSQWGSEGYGDRKLEYCQKWYPNTTRVEPYKTETITTWRAARNTGEYSYAVVTDKCVQGIVIGKPSIKVVSPNGGEVFLLSDTFRPEWKEKNIPFADLQYGAEVSIVDLANPATEYSVGRGESTFGTTISHTKSIAQAPSIGKKNFILKVHYKNSGITDFSDDTFTIKKEKEEVDPRTTCGVNDSVTVDGVTYTLNPSSVSEIMVDGQGNKTFSASISQSKRTLYGFSVYFPAVGFPQYGVMSDIATGGAFGTTQINFSLNDKALWADGNKNKTYSGCVPIHIYTGSESTDGNYLYLKLNVVVKPSTVLIEEEPAVILVSPNGGEVYEAGKAMTVKWDTKGFDKTKNKIMVNLITRDSDGNYRAVQNSAPFFVNEYVDDGIETIVIPGTISAGSNYYIEVQSYEKDATGYQTNFVYDRSDAPFTISLQQTKICPINGSSIKVLSPNGGETYTYEGKIPVKWESCNVPSTDYLRIGLLQFDSNNNIIANVATHTTNGSPLVLNSGATTIYELPNTGGWGTYAPGNFYKISIVRCRIGTATTCTTDQNVIDESDNRFTIKSNPAAQYVNLISPVSGSTLEAGKEVEVTWNSNLKPNSEIVVIISYGGVRVKQVYTKNDGVEMVKIPKNTLSGQYTVELTNGWAVNPIVYTKAVFNVVSNTVTVCPIENKASVRVISPNDGEEYTEGEQILVNWATCKIPESAQMKIDLVMYKKNGGTIARTLSYSTPNDGSEIMKLPTSSDGFKMNYGNNFKIKIRRVNTSAGQDLSDQMFTVLKR
jgi:hypothetical protein